MEIRETPYRPERLELPSDNEDEAAECDDLVKLMKRCWDETPANRPTFYEIKKKLRENKTGKLEFLCYMYMSTYLNQSITVYYVEIQCNIIVMYNASCNIEER